MLDETTRKFVLCRPPPTIIHTDKKNKKAKKNIKVVVTTWHLAWLILNKMPLLFYSSNGHFVFVNRDVFVVSTKNKKSSTSKNLKYQDISYHNNTRIHDSCYYEIKIVSAAVVVISHRCTNRKMFPDTKKQWAGEMMQAAVKLKLLLCCAFRNSSIFRAIMLYGWKFYVPYPAYIAYKKTKKIK